MYNHKNYTPLKKNVSSKTYIHTYNMYNVHSLKNAPKEMV
jgi:hypothetical protein